jgi:hypothetical protein
VQQQYPINVLYDGVLVGEYIADALVEGSVLVELQLVGTEELALVDAWLQDCARIGKGCA